MAKREKEKEDEDEDEDEEKEDVDRKSRSEKKDKSGRGERKTGKTTRRQTTKSHSRRRSGGDVDDGGDEEDEDGDDGRGRGGRAGSGGPSPYVVLGGALAFLIAAVSFLVGVKIHKDNAEQAKIRFADEIQQKIKKARETKDKLDWDAAAKAYEDALEFASRPGIRLPNHAESR